MKSEGKGFKILKYLLYPLSILLICSKAYSSQYLLRGVDVHDKSEIYELVLGPKNLLLEERSFSLLQVKKNSTRKSLVGDVVFIESPQTPDGGGFYLNSEVSIRLGPIQTVINTDKKKQLIVVKFKADQNDSKLKTIVFETDQPID